MSRDQIRGATRLLKGRAQSALGGLTGDPARQVRGAVNQVDGGAQYAYGRARDRAGDFADDRRALARDACTHADALIDDGRHLVRHVGRRGAEYGRRAARSVDANRTRSLMVLAALAFATGWLVRRAG